MTQLMLCNIAYKPSLEDGLSITGSQVLSNHPDILREPIKKIQISRNFSLMLRYTPYLHAKYPRSKCSSFVCALSVSHKVTEEFYI